MRLRAKWMAAGMVWGTVAGALAAAAPLALATGAWTGPAWLEAALGASPGWARTLLSLLGVATVSGLAAAGAVAGRARGRREEAAGRSRDPDAHLDALRALGLALLVALGLGLLAVLAPEP